MADMFEQRMKAVADAANAAVDYAAMYEAIAKKAAAEKRRRAQFLRYGAMAASAVILLGTGSLFLLSGGSMKSADLAAPESMEMARESTAAAGAEAGNAASGSAPMEAPVPEASFYTADNAVPAASSAPAAEPETAAETEMPETVAEAAVDAGQAGMNGAPLMPADAAAGASASASRGLTFLTYAELIAAWQAQQGPLADFTALFGPANWAEGYRLMEITADDTGLYYRCNKAAADVYNDTYTVFIPDYFLLEGGEPAVVQVFPEEGCSLDESELEALLAIEKIA